MLPDNALSTEPVPGTYLHPDGLVTSPLQDYELGGVALNDPSEGLQVKVWTCFVDGTNIMIQPAGGASEALFEAPGTTEVALAFDQNMRPAVAFKQAGVCKLRWYDTAVGEQVITSFAGVDNIRLALDDKRPTQNAANDIIMAYTKGGNLYFRAQRDRFGVEYLLEANIGPGRLLRLGMTTANRLQFEFAGGADPDDPTWPLVGDLWHVPDTAGFAEGEVVGLWADGFGFMGFKQVERFGERLVIDFAPAGVAEDDRPTELVIGYPYDGEVRMLPFAAPDGRGPILGRKRRLIRTIVAVEDAAALLVNDEPLLPMTGEGQSRQLTNRTGEYEVRTLGWTTSDEVVIRAVSPYDATVRAVLREYTDGR